VHLLDDFFLSEKREGKKQEKDTHTTPKKQKTLAETQDYGKKNVIAFVVEISSLLE
jgi:hypothetical protein